MPPEFAVRSKAAASGLGLFSTTMLIDSTPSMPVSTVTGTLATGRDVFDLLRATFPPGSMTGAPKLASISLLEKLETVRRGVYAGALGYLDLRGGLDLSVVIRTIIWKDGQAHLHVGGGVVADSSPEAEYLESLDKAKAPLAALDEALAREER